MKLLSLLLLSFSTNLWALSEKEIIRSVIDHYPLIEESALKAEAAEADVTAAKGAFDHKLMVKSRLWRQRPYNNEYLETYLERQTPFLGAKIVAGHRQGAGEFNFYDLKKDTSSAGQIFAGITMPLLRNLSTDSYRTDLEISKIQKEQADQQVRLKKLVYVHKALSLYYKWVLQSKRVEISEQILDLAKTRQEMLEKKFKAGDTDKLKVTDNRRQINKRESEWIENDIELLKLATELSLYVRDSEGKPVLVKRQTDAEQTLLAPLIQKAGVNNNSNPQLKILSFEQKINDAQFKLNDQGRLPGLNVGVTGGRELSNRPGYGDHILEVGINFDFPLENRKADGKSVSYHYKQKAVEKEILYMKQQLDQQFSFSREASDNSHKRWEVSNREYENTKKVADGERKKWTLGATDLFVVNLREQDQADVDQRRWKALYEYHQYNLDASLFSASLPVE